MSSDKKRTDKVAQFREISDADKALISRLVVDKNHPSGGNLKRADLSIINRVFRRTARETADIRNIFKSLPDLNLPREILVSAICAPGDLSKPTLVFGTTLDNVDTALTTPMTMFVEKFFIDTKRMVSKVPEWIDDALILSGAHPIIIIPESSLDRLISNGISNESLQTISSFDSEFVDGWFRPKGIFAVPLSREKDFSYVSFESAEKRINKKDMLEYHTIKAKGPDNKTYKLPFVVTDNMMALRIPKVQAAKRARAMESILGTPSLEAKRRQRIEKERNEVKQVRGEDGHNTTSNSKDELSSSEVYTKFFKNVKRVNQSRVDVVLTSSQTGRENFGHPLELHPASEAFLPICVPGDVTNQVGGILLLDSNGYPISYTRRTDYYEDIRGTLRGVDYNGSVSHQSGEILQLAKTSLQGSLSNVSNQDIDRLARLQSTMLEQDILARLKHGMLGGDFEISKPDHVNLLMLSRALKGQMTTMLFVPAELLIYIAFDYNEYGVGKSILEDAKDLAAHRAAVQVANVIGATKNAIPGKDITISLDQELRDVEEAVAFMANEALGLAYHEFPHGIFSSATLAEALQMSAININVEGHPRYPEIKTAVNASDTNWAQIDTELQRQLRDDLNRVFGLTSEMVDGINQPEFATTAVINNLMLLKRVMVCQDKANPFLTDYVRTFTYNSGILIDGLLEIVEQNKKLLPADFKNRPEDFVEEFINNLICKLPEPPTENLKKQLDELDEYANSIDKVLPYMLREEYFDGYSEDYIRDALPTLIVAAKGMLMRDKIRSMGLLRELDIFGTSEDGSPLMDMAKEASTHVDAVTKVVAEYAKRVAKDALARKQLMNGVKTVHDKATALNGESTDEMREGGDDVTGMDDTDMLDMDDSTEDTSAGDTIPEEEEETEDEEESEEQDEEPEPEEDDTKKS